MFTHLDLGPGDFVEIQNGTNVEMNNLKINQRRASIGRVLWVRFQSHYHYTFTGFEMKIKFVEKPKGK